MDAMERLISQATQRQSPAARDVGRRKTPESAAAREGDRKKTPEELDAERKAREEEEREEEELEKACEQWCGKICRIGVVVPLLFAYILQPIGDFLMRPSMEAVRLDRDLEGTSALITGGCSGIGLHVAELLAQGGANVTLACRQPRGAEAQKALRAVQEATDRWSAKRASFGASAAPTPAVLSLRLDSLASVRSFTERYATNVGRLNMLVNAAGTRQACEATEDGYEVAFQVNYLAHFLLVKRLLPLMRQSGGHARIVHVTCRDGYIRPARGWNHRFQDGWFQGWLGLPVPITEGIRVGSTYIEPRRSVGEPTEDSESGHEIVDDEEEAQEPAGQSREGKRPLKSGKLEANDWLAHCKTDRAYSNAKLAVLAFSKELERRLRASPDSEDIVSHAVNPNAVATEFASKGSPVDTSQSSAFGGAMQYLPPVWIGRKIFGFFHDAMSRAMLRPVEHGARAVFHVATAEALAHEGGALFDDTESAFVDCGRQAHRCGRVPRSWEPRVVHDRQAAEFLWELSEELVKG